MEFNFPNKTKLYIFDDYLEEVLPGQLLGLPYVNDGWAHRKVFVANADSETISVVATYNLSLA